jgi:hypothetical protein
MTSMQSVLIAGAGVVLSTAVSVTALVPYSAAASDSLMPSGPWLIYLAVIGTAAALALTATLLPTWQALRSPRPKPPHRPDQPLTRRTRMQHGPIPRRDVDAQGRRRRPPRAGPAGLR